MTREELAQLADEYERCRENLAKAKPDTLGQADREMRHVEVELYYRLVFKKEAFRHNGCIYGADKYSGSIVRRLEPKGSSKLGRPKNHGRK
jgi:hypothetical protein